MSKETVEQIAALKRVLNYAKSANCDDLHHPKKFLHDNTVNCPAQDAMRSDASIVREFFQQQEVRVRKLECLLRDIRGDLRLRGDIDSDGVIVVNLSGSIWEKLNEVLDNE